MQAIKGLALGARFLLELCALAALAYWGFGRDASWPARVALGLGAPLLAALVWGAVVAPKARFKLGRPARAGCEALVWCAGVVALWLAGQHALALVFAVVIVADRAALLATGA
jgi:hypothetical protein